MSDAEKELERLRADRAVIKVKIKGKAGEGLPIHRIL